MTLRDDLRAAIGTTDSSEGLPHWHTVIDTPDGQPRHNVYVERQAVLDAIDALALPVPALDTLRAALESATRVIRLHNLTPTGRLRRCDPECVACAWLVLHDTPAPWREMGAVIRGVPETIYLITQDMDE